MLTAPLPVRSMMESRLAGRSVMDVTHQAKALPKPPQSPHGAGGLWSVIYRNSAGLSYCITSSWL